ncbi:MAG: 3-hydroxyacyl-CoA dehydrogenase [Alphaproteobacteria bacterium]|nr:3-hydroxyacyl-CoA dehydrogenase [Alphaproteobacteria bacterium]
MAALPTSATVAVIGAGTMGAGIAQVAATAGHPVLLFDSFEGAVARGIAGIEKFLGRSIDKGKITGAERDAILGRITACDTLEELAPAKLVIEAIVEDLAVKQDLFKKLEGIVAEDAILASNTSSLSITAIGGALARPERLVGMHFFNPAPLMALVEVITGLATSPDAADTLIETSTAWGKAPVRAKSTPGFIVNRCARSFYAEAQRVLWEGGADIPTIDSVMKEAGGFRMGPFELMDLIGADVNLAVSHSVWNAYFRDPRYTPSLLQTEQVAAGRLGRKSGRGWYDHAEGAERPEPLTAPPGPMPKSVRIVGDLGPAEPLAGLIEKAGIPLKREKDPDELGAIHVDAGDAEAVLMLTHGATATERAHWEEKDNLVHFDLALDFGAASRVAIAAADQAAPAALEAAAGFFQALGKSVSVIDDVPGMIVMRTVAMLVNEAADAVNQGVCDAADLDTAMIKGVNYPRGPLAWADFLSPAWVLVVSDGLYGHYGEDRYRPSPLLRRKVFGGAKFHE